MDLRRQRFQLAQSPLKIAGVVFLSSQQPGARPLLEPLSKSAPVGQSNLLFEQAYAAGQPQWRMFTRNLSRLAAFELRRGRHPLEAVDALRSLLAT